MKLRLLIIVITLLFLPYGSAVLAENISSSNYVLVDPELLSASGSTSSTNYSALLNGSGGVGYGQISSSLYKIGSGQGYTFMANTPKIKCFETATDNGTTNCTDLPANNGMVGECGETGCYDRAMVQIDTEGNPTDAVYSIQISKDNWTTIMVVDGSTHTLKPFSSKAISDYLSAASWHSTPWDGYNVIGLQANTEYKVRATALHGDFTESEVSPPVTATTSLPTVTFDLDISPDLLTDTNAPYTVNLGALVPETAKFENSQRVKVDVSTNAQSGISVYVKDAHTGIRSTSTSYTIASSSEDLSNPASGDGFGLQESGTTQSVSSAGFVVPTATFDLSGSNVGAVSSSGDTLAFCTLVSSLDTCGSDPATWVTAGKALFTIGVRASLTAPAKADYTDTLTFTITGGW
ncbi:hypothetical protein IT418_02355 [bacterium]|nr:hypothetical protein [bacterium]